MKEEIKKAVQEYQCSGCVCGSDISCYVNNEYGVQCSKHVVGTRGTGIGKFLLGMPIGFNRVGPCEKMRVYIFENVKQKDTSWEYSKFNISVWKHKTESNNIIIRGIMPRINQPFLHVIIDGNDFDKINCLEITKKDMDEMD